MGSVFALPLGVSLDVIRRSFLLCSCVDLLPTLLVDGPPLTNSPMAAASCSATVSSGPAVSSNRLRPAGSQDFGIPLSDGVGVSVIESEILDHPKHYSNYVIRIEALWYGGGYEVFDVKFFSGCLS